jgi:hypothetical protein
MENNIHYKFWIDKEFDGRLYDIALKEKPTKEDLIDCIGLFIDQTDNQFELTLYKYKYLERLYEFLVYYADKQIFFNENDRISNSSYPYLCPISNLIYILYNTNQLIDNYKYKNKKIDPIDILDLQYERCGIKPSLYIIYCMQCICNINLIDRYDLKDIDTIEHLKIINIKKILIPTKFSIKTLEEFCKEKMKTSILTDLLKYLVPNITCLENACINNKLNIIKMIMKCNKELIPNLKCMDNGIKNRDINSFLYDYIKKDYLEMKEYIDKQKKEIKPEVKQFEKNQPIEIKPVKKIKNDKKKELKL